MADNPLNDERAVRLAEELAKGPAFERKYFPLWQRYGFHITPNHFYQPIPDTSRLRADLWERPSELPGLDMNEGAQLAFLEDVCLPFRREYSCFAAKPTGVPYEFHFDQYMFRMVDAEVLYCVLRRFKPARIVEIGSGFSTLVAAAACRKNREEGHNTSLISVDPYPDPVLRGGFPGLERLIEQPLEEVDRNLFATLGNTDVLFIDSSHVLRIGSDVYYEYLEILPRLAPGVFVHIHDIFLPLEYPQEWIFEECRFWTEQYLLQAFLCFNSAFTVRWAGCYMHWKHPERLREAFPSYDPATTLPGSFWIQRNPA